MSAPTDKLDERQLRRLCKNQQAMLHVLQSKVERQRAYINRIIDAESNCVFRIEVELLREELDERNHPLMFADITEGLVE